MNWKKGPLPPDTYWWGGVVTKEIEGHGGFYFADFCGDHVMTFPSDKPNGTRVEAEDVVLYDNSLQCPPRSHGFNCPKCGAGMLIDRVRGPYCPKCD